MFPNWMFRLSEMCFWAGCPGWAAMFILPLIDDRIDG